jgi:hypothetical protein
MTIRAAPPGTVESRPQRLRTRGGDVTERKSKRLDVRIDERVREALETLNSEYG